jgi:hypothetical protein
MTSERKYAVVRRKHGLYRPENIRKLWWGFLAVLALTVLLQSLVEVHDHFGVDGVFGFSALYGFFACVAMVIVAKILGWWLKRPDTYYPDEHLFLWTQPMARETDWTPEEEETEGSEHEGGDV